MILNNRAEQKPLAERIKNKMKQQADEMAEAYINGNIKDSLYWVGNSANKLALFIKAVGRIEGGTQGERRALTSFLNNKNL